MGRIGRAVFTVGAIGLTLLGLRGGGPGSEKARDPSPIRPQSLFFEKNNGQADDRALYLARGQGYGLALARSEAVLTLSGAPELPVRLRFDGGNQEPRVLGLDELPGKVYYSPAHSSGRLEGHSTFRRVRYEDVYDGIDVVYYGSDERLEFDLEIAPGADPSRVALALDGASDLAISPSGDLTFRAARESVTLHRPFIYQERDGVRSEVKGAYVLTAQARVGFALGDYDHSQPLVVDPLFSFNTAGDDIVRGVDVNAAGEVYLLGETTNSAGFPWGDVQPGSKTTQCYLAKMDPSSSSVLYTILFRGTDKCSTLALSPNGVAYFPGYETPVTPGLHATTLVRVDETFGVNVERIQVNNYSPIDNQVGAVAADANEKIYLLGTCRVVVPGTPPLELAGFNDAPDAGSGQPTCAAGSSTKHALLTKVDRDGIVEYATFLAPDDIEGVNGAGLAVDADERVFVVRPRSTAVPVTVNAYRDTCPDPAACGYLMAIDTTQGGLASLQYATYLWQMTGSERQVLRLGGPDSVYLASEGEIGQGFPQMNFNPYPDFPRPLDPDTGTLLNRGIQVARFDFDPLRAPNLLRYARIAVGLSLHNGSEHLVDLRILPSGAAVVGVLLAPDPNGVGQPFQSDFRTYYRSGVNAFRGNDVTLQMYPNTSGARPAFALALTPAGARVTAQEFSATSAPGPSEILVDVASVGLDPGPNTPPTISISPPQPTVESYDPTGAIVQGFQAAYDWDEEAGTSFGIAVSCTHDYNVTRFPVGTTQASCTATDDAGATVTQAFEVTVNAPANTTAANVPITLVDVTVPPGSLSHTPGNVTVTFQGTVNASGLTWLRTRTDQKPFGPPQGFQLGSSPFYYDVGTTADTTGPIQLCIDFTGMSFAVPAGVRLFHLAGPIWNDVTDTVDLNTHRICTIAPDANELGTFAIFTPADERTRVEVLAGVGRYPGNYDDGVVPEGDGGPATAAALSSPSAVAFDVPRNAMYIAGSRHLRRVDLVTGIITRYAGVSVFSSTFGNPVEGGLATATEFMQIDDVAVDREGNLFLAEAQNCVIQRIDRVTGVVRNVAGAWLGSQPGSCGNTGDGGAARSAKISLPWRMVFDAQGNLFFIQSSGLPQQVFTGTAGFIRRIAAGADGLIQGRPEETISTIAGSGQQVPVEGSPLASGMAPHAVAFGRAGELYVASYDRILRILPAPGTASLTGHPAESLRIVAGGDPLVRLPFGGDQGHPLAADLLLMSDLEVLPAGELLVSHANSARIRIITPGADGAVDGSADERVTTVAGFGYQFVAGPFDVSDFSPTGYALSTLFFPGSATRDPRGGIVVTDFLRHYVRRFGYRAQGLAFSALSIDFGPQTIGTTSAARTIAVTNDAPNPITVTTATTTGNFTLDSSACQTIAAGGTCSIQVFFAPGTVGPLAGELQLTDSTLTVHRVALSGIGTGIPAVSLTPSSLTFAAQLVGTTSPPQTVTLTNTGNGNLTIAGIAIVGADFAHTTICPAVLGPALSCAIDVVLRPVSSGGLRTGELRVTSDAAGSPHVVTLTGFGDTRLLSVSSPVVDLGPVPVGSTSASSTVTLTNTGSLPLTLNGYQVVGSTSADIINTFAGNGEPFQPTWPDGSPALTVPIGSPFAIAADPRGNVYFATEVANTFGNGLASRIVRVDGARRTLTTVWTEGTTTGVADNGGNLGNVVSLAIDRSGNLYVAEFVQIPFLPTTGGRVRRLDAVSGAITVFAGNGVRGSSGDGGSALAASFEPTSIAVDGSGNLLIADSNFPSNPLRTSIRRVDASTGIITRVAGGGMSGMPSDGNGGLATDAFLARARGVTVDAAGNIFILDSDVSFNPLWFIRKVDAATGIIQRFGINSLQLDPNQRVTLAIDPLGNLIVNEPTRVRRFEGRTGASSYIAGIQFQPPPPNGDGGPATDARFNRIDGVAVDASGNLYVSDGPARRVRRVDAFTTSGATLFPTTSDCGTSLGVGAFCSLTVRFQAAVPGPQRAELQFASDASGAPHRIALTGAGTRPLALVSPAALTFAERVVATPSPDMNVIVANSGNADLPLSRLEVVGSDANNFSLSHACLSGIPPSSLSPGDTCVATIVFTPDQPGMRSAELRVFHGAGGSPAIVPLNGVGAPLSLTISPTSLDFGVVPVNTAATLPVALTNTGTALVNVSQRSLTGTHASDFDATGCPGDLGAGASCTLLVTFRPQAGGVRSAQLFVVRMGPGWLAVDLQGTGSLDSAIALSHPALDFGSVAVGAPPQHRTATITNVGTVPIAVTDLAVAGRMTHPGSVRTLAGDGAAGAGPEGVLAIEAHLGDIYDVAVDADGNQYLADASLHRVWRIDAVTGRITTVAGTGTQGYLGDGGPAVAARLDTPTSVAVDSAGLLYIADTGNHRVRRVGPTGLIETFAGNGTPAYAGDGGLASEAFLNSPQGLAFDTSGALLIAETLNHVIRRVASDGTISTLVGDGVAGAGFGANAGPVRLHGPVDIAVSPAGDLAIADAGNARVMIVEQPATPDRRVGTTPLVTAGGVAWDSLGRVLVAETQNHRLWRLDLAYLTDQHEIVVAGSGQSGWQDAGSGLSARFSSPRGLAVDITGHILVADTGNRRLRQVDGTASDTGTAFTRTLDCVRTLLPQESCVVDVTFAPGFPGLHRAHLTITHDAASGPRVLELSGLGAQPIGFVTPRVVPLLGVEVGTTRTASMRLVNSGNGPLQFAGLTITGTHGPSFSATSNCPAILGPGAGCDIAVTFAPLAVGLLQSTLEVMHDGLPPQHTYLLTGTSTPARTETSLTSPASGSVFGQPVTLQVLVTSPFGTPGGTITFTSGGVASPHLTAIPLTGGTGILSTTALPAGTYAIRAHYGGDALHATSVSSPLDYTVAKQPTSVTLTAATASIVYGQTLNLTANVTTPTGGLIAGSVRFLDGGTPIGAPVSISLGSAGLSIVPAAGTHAYTAEYLGDANSDVSTSSAVTVAVAKATTTTTLTASPNPAYVNFPVTFTATVAPQYGGAVSGSVTFRSGATVLGVAAIVGNQATLTTTFDTFQTRSITVTYGGDGNLVTSTSSPALQLVVQRVPTTVTVTSSPNPSFVGEPVTFTVTVSSPFGPPPDGQQVRLSGTSPGAPAILNLAGGTATYVVSNMPAGIRSVNAVYAGNQTYATSSAPYSHSVNKYPTTVSLASSANPSTFGSSVTFTAVVSSAGGTPPDGQLVTFTVPGVVSATRPLSGGIATFTPTATTPLRVGTNSVTASYGGDARFLASSSPLLPQVVSSVATTTTVTSTPNPSSLGTRVTFTAVVTSASGVTPTGSVTFRRGNIHLGTATLIAGQATFQTQPNTLPRGSWTITAIYSPSPANFVTSVGTVEHVVQ